MTPSSSAGDRQPGLRVTTGLRVFLRGRVTTNVPTKVHDVVCLVAFVVTGEAPAGGWGGAPRRPPCATPRTDNGLPE
jgi:hypothetical protein